MKAVMPSMELIKTTLESMDVSFTDNGSSITAELTVTELNHVAELPSVVTITEEYIASMDAEPAALYYDASEIAFRGKLAAAPSMAEADDLKNRSSWPYVAASMTVFAGISMVALRRRAN